MGMAAGQARLLSITSRMSDNELRAQLINNSKMRLATESSKVSENYVAALNNAQLMFTNYGPENAMSYQQLTFNSLTNYCQYNNQYALTNAAGQVLVSEADAANFLASDKDLNKFLECYRLSLDTTYFDQFKDNAFVSKFGTSYTGAELEAMYGTQGKNYLSILQSDEYFNFEDNLNTVQTLYETIYNNEDYISTVQKLINYNSISYDSDGNVLGSTINKTDYTSWKADVKHPENDYWDNGNNNPVTWIGVFSAYLSGLSEDNVIEPAFVDKVLNIIREAYLEVGGYYGIPKTSDFTVNNFTASNNKTYEYDPASKCLTLANGDKYKISYEKTIDPLTGDVTTNKYTISALDNKGNIITDDAGNKCETVIDLNAGQTYSSIDNGDIIIEASENQLNFIYTSGAPGPATGGVAHNHPNANYIERYEFTFNSSSGVTGCKNHYYGLTGRNDILFNALQSAMNLFEQNFVANSKIDTVMSKAIESKTSYDFMDEAKSLQDAVKALSEIFYGQGTTKSMSYTNFLSEAALIEALTDGTTDEKGYTPKGFKDGVLADSNIMQILILENLFDIYGEPNITWIDEKDNENHTGNASHKAQWYKNLFNRMMNGFKVLGNGLASSPEWIEFALESGLVTMEQVTDTDKWNSISYTNVSDITEQTNQNTVTIAEAEYQKAMNQIEAKDKQYDIELKNIDTEHNSLQTEYDSIKTAIDKNVERMFKMYS